MLLVEDDDAARDMYGGLLWYNGYDVHHAGDGRTAIDLALALDPDVILLDLGLPGDLDGVAVCERLRERGLAAPIVALTARSRDELGVTPESIGFVDYIEKPIEPYAVVRQVQRLIGYAQPDGIR